jgi:hypothetical protein
MMTKARRRAPSCFFPESQRRLGNEDGKQRLLSFRLLGGRRSLLLWEVTNLIDPYCFGGKGEP